MAIKETNADRIESALRSLGGSANSRAIADIPGINQIPGDVSTILAGMARKGRVIRGIGRPAIWSLPVNGKEGY